VVERTTRFLVLFGLADGRDAQSVADALREAVSGLPAGALRSIAWDQGRELAYHARFTAETGIPVFFCDPHSPWQRGLNENTNGLVRQYLPKGTDLSCHSAAELQRIARSLNGRPRKVLGYMTHHWRNSPSTFR
jgi:IS30 family transposase